MGSRLRRSVALGAVFGVLVFAGGAWAADPPETQIDSGPTGPVSDTNATFTFSSPDEPTSTFECNLDSAGFAPCGSPLDLVGLSQGQHILEVRALLTLPDLTPASQTWTVDTIAPAAPSGLSTAPASPANDNLPEVKGAAEAGSTVRVYQAADCTGGFASDSAAVFGGAGITITVPGNATASIAATATDDAGNVSVCSAPIAYTEDSTPPGAPSGLATTPASPSSDNTPRVTGSAEAGSVVAVFRTSNCTGTSVAGTQAEFASPGIAVSVPSDETTSLTARATDAAGNLSSCSAAISYTEDSSGPPAPTGLATTPASPSSDATPNVRGTSEAGSIVEVFTTADCTGAQVSGSAAAFAGAGIQVTVATNGTTQISARAIDAVLNVSPCSAPIAYVHDNVAPAAPTGLATSPASPSNDNTPEVRGTAEPGSTVDVYATANCTGPVTSGSAATFAAPGIPKTVGANSTTSFSARARDAADNPSPCSVPIVYIEDSIVPTAAVAFPQAVTYDGTTWNAGCSTAAGDICGTASDNAGGSGLVTVQVSIQRGNTNQYWNGAGFVAGGEQFVTTVGTSAWAYALDALSLSQDGAYRVRARARDAAGNEGTSATIIATISRPGPETDVTFPGLAVFGDAGWNAGCGTPSGDICGTASSDPGRNVAAVKVTIRRAADGLYWDGAGFTSANPILLDATPIDGAFNSSSEAWRLASFPAANFPTEGGYIVQATAIDDAQPPLADPAPDTAPFVIDRVGPAAATSFPAAGGSYNAGWLAGCVVPGFCGTASDGGGSGVESVLLGVQRVETGRWWNGSSFASSTPTFPLAADGTTSWVREFGINLFPADGAYVLRILVEDLLGQQSTVDVGFAIDRVPPATAIDSGPSGTVAEPLATFTFSASEPAAFECRLEGSAFARCTSPASFAGLGDGGHVFDVRAVDAAGNADATPESRAWTVMTSPTPPPPPPPGDSTPPGKVAKLKATSRDRRVTLSWSNPTDADLDRVEITRVVSGRPPVTVFRGIAKRFVDARLRNGTRYSYVLAAIDRAGNRSAEARATATPAVLFAPTNGARLATAPVLAWEATSKANFYNVQLYRGRTKVLSIWPVRARLKLHGSWRYEGRRQRLTPGLYMWYVWPGFGRPEQARYGKLLGKSTFVIRRKG